MIHGLKPFTADMLIHSNLKDFDEYSLVDLPVVVDAHVIVSRVLDYLLKRRILIPFTLLRTPCQSSKRSRPTGPEPRSKILPSRCWPGQVSASMALAIRAMMPM